MDKDKGWEDCKYSWLYTVKGRHADDRPWLLSSHLGRKVGHSIWIKIGGGISRHYFQGQKASCAQTA